MIFGITWHKNQVQKHKICSLSYLFLFQVFNGTDKTPTEAQVHAKSGPKNSGALMCGKSTLIFLVILIGVLIYVSIPEGDAGPYEFN